jgi:hypothetical protein
MSLRCSGSGYITRLPLTSNAFRPRTDQSNGMGQNMSGRKGMIIWGGGDGGKTRLEQMSALRSTPSLEL